MKGYGEGLGHSRVVGRIKDSVSVRVRVRVNVRLRVRVRGGAGVVPTTSHSDFYSRVGQIAIFSHCQP